MQGQRFRPLIFALGAIILIWLVAAAGFAVARNYKMTPAKIRQFVAGIDFSKLSPSERARVLKELAAKLNALSLEERRDAHLENDWRPWFAQMTDAEKDEFITATLPNNVKQMLDAFEQMPADKRKKAVESAVKNMKNPRQPRAAAANGTNDVADSSSTNTPTQLSPELVQKAETLGLKTFYTEGSAETKAELAPLIEEIQHQMESGRPIR